MSSQIEVVFIEGLCPFQKAWTLQRERLEHVRRGTMPNALFLLEHAPVITLGRNSRDEHVLASSNELSRKGIEVVSTDRGGDVTYHGPGQMVAYPILNLRQWQKSIRWYLRSLEEVVITLLDTYGVSATREPPFTGVWARGEKVAAIGVGLRDWVTFHGLSLNVNTDLKAFELIVPCGLYGKSVTSLQKILGKSLSMADVMERFTEIFCRQFSANQPKIF
ncbi:MAG TPA: lipoyl(octanoyl) transferase LipB [Candidatus Hydrogenedentes bacterium]|nr:lipoyl(octanoyl) transferase LipB [Candidatus Hydrogenedentota bacterium]HOL75746.1 lipoyl(octanoyl) transferase LipB [Candidatus Hydrogenedentota bacterium]HPO84261.1 lipoyl(octanoyl) transferase LipB [Candidatus Hydrogenedentota bacterium]